MQMSADVKCYHCGHISGQVEGTKDDRLVLHKFIPRQGYRGPKVGAGDRLRCERCQGPVFLEDLRPVPAYALDAKIASTRRTSRGSRGKAA